MELILITIICVQALLFTYLQHRSSAQWKKACENIIAGADELISLSNQLKKQAISDTDVMEFFMRDTLSEKVYLTKEVNHDLIEYSFPFAEHDKNIKSGCLVVTSGTPAEFKRIIMGMLRMLGERIISDEAKK